MNDKQAKRIRQGMRKAAAMMGMPDFHEYDRKLNAHMVDSRKYKMTNNETGEVFEGKAMQWRLDPNCPRAIYRRIKARVSRSSAQEIREALVSGQSQKGTEVSKGVAQEKSSGIPGSVSA